MSLKKWAIPRQEKYKMSLEHLVQKCRKYSKYKRDVWNIMFVRFIYVGTCANTLFILIVALFPTIRRCYNFLMHSLVYGWAFR